MSSIHIGEKVSIIINEILPTFRGLKIELTNDLSLVDSGILDSVSIVRAVQMLQDEFNIVIEASDITLDNFDTIDLIAYFIQQRLS